MALLQIDLPLRSHPTFLISPTLLSMHTERILSSLSVQECIKTHSLRLHSLELMENRVPHPKVLLSHLANDKMWEILLELFWWRILPNHLPTQAFGLPHTET
jgi:hypothetical protein